MRTEWVPLSAAALITGAMALLLSEFISVDTAGGVASAFATAEENPGRWTAMSVLWSVSATGFVLGAPCVMVALPGRGRIMGYVGVALFAMGAIGVAGYAALSMVFRAMAMSSVTPAEAEEVFDDRGLSILLLAWVGALFLGLVVIAIALLVSRGMAPWVPILLLVFVAVQIAFRDVDLVQKAGYLALAAGCAGIAIDVAAPASRRRIAAQEGYGSISGTKA